MQMKEIFDCISRTYPCYEPQGQIEPYKLDQKLIAGHCYLRPEEITPGSSSN